MKAFEAVALSTASWSRALPRCHSAAPGVALVIGKLNSADAILFQAMLTNPQSTSFSGGCGNGTVTFFRPSEN